MGSGLKGDGLEEKRDGIHSATAVWSQARAIIAEALVEVAESYQRVSSPSPWCYSKQEIYGQARHNAAAIIARLAQKDLLIVPASEFGKCEGKCEGKCDGKGDEEKEVVVKWEQAVKASGSAGASEASSAAGATGYPDHTFGYTLGVFVLWIVMIFGTSWFLCNAMGFIPGWVYVPMAFMLTVWSCWMTLWAGLVVVSFVETFGKGK